MAPREKASATLGSLVIFFVGLATSGWNMNFVSFSHEKQRPELMIGLFSPSFVATNAQSSGPGNEPSWSLNLDSVST